MKHIYTLCDIIDQTYLQHLKSADQGSTHYTHTLHISGVIWWGRDASPGFQHSQSLNLTPPTIVTPNQPSNFNRLESPRSHTRATKILNQWTLAIQHS